MIKLNVSNFVQGEPDITKEEKITKNKAGKVTSQKNYSTASSSNSGAASLKIFGPVNKYEAPLSDQKKREKKKMIRKRKKKMLKRLILS